ncbi:hypothetical protein [Hymenobacter sp. UYP22]|uniref:hypothetical protein n=1 Tax=Hymenobacter sp. UYP22 TaxID=3156348 RepID=UPI003392B50B
MPLSFSQTQWNELAQRFPFGTTIHGIIVHVARFGVFVQVDEFPDVNALLEIIHMPYTQAEPSAEPFHPLSHPDQYPATGSRIEALILGWSEKPGDVRLTQLIYNQDASV